MGIPVFVLAALLSGVVAQDTTSTVTDFLSTETTSPTSTSTQPITVTIAVGNGGHTFIPDVVQVSPGNYVEFDFYPLNHSVVRAEYMYPCIPYELTGVDKVGFYSGFHPVDAILSDPPKWTVLINDTEPIFYYCGAPNSCIGYQMVGVINPNSSTSIQAQKQYAADSSFMLLPGENWPDEEDPFATTSTSTATATATSTVTTSTASSTSASTAGATTTPAASGSGHSGLSTGAIAGIAVGGAAAVIAAAVILYLCGRRSKSKKNKEEAGGASLPGPSTPAMGPMNSPPAYIPPANNYGYMSPTQKHMSVSTMPATDAFGNAIPAPGAYPSPYSQTFPQGYPAPPQQLMTNTGVAHPQSPPAWPSTPSNDIFGASSVAGGPYQMHDGSVAGGAMESMSLRASSPNSAIVAGPQAAAPGVVGGIEAFLQRQSRMSPPPPSEIDAQHTPSVVAGSAGPFEMSAAPGTMNRFP
ncbi:hypothetical protein Z517_11942 [Fonsecaea pedrosoi CBS 271.37]|uniref:Phytocyanin domain-containing protein n=1 Tax=Fonsecaea pedrosoi CBS 271.37 TaxID=1442368 RepID=A0A0D2G8P5_9EURO|nr:uncharacterized protein Z517_11942 [Fonsecaea pedrosoi CBS 271.37]KIW75170.1 hypothetical protein Z517_11942 [Fonsecaea pedrosoi CBS 271.37]